MTPGPCPLLNPISYHPPLPHPALATLAGLLGFSSKQVLSQRFRFRWFLLQVFPGGTCKEVGEAGLANRKKLRFHEQFQILQEALEGIIPQSLSSFDSSIWSVIGAGHLRRT